MRLFLAAAAMLALVGLAQAGKVEVKNVHLCCGNCTYAVTNTLKKIDGVGDIKPDQKGRAVTFTAKDDKVAETAVKALVDAGFFGAATHDGKVVKVELPAVKSEKADEVVVKDVHVCCKACMTAISGLFKGSTVTYAGTGSQREVKVSGKGLDKADVVKTLRDAGFSGKVN